MMPPHAELNAVDEKERVNWKWVLDPCFIENSISVNIQLFSKIDLYLHLIPILFWWVKKLSCIY